MAFNADSLRMSNELAQENMRHQQLLSRQHCERIRLQSYSASFVILEKYYRTFRIRMLQISFNNWVAIAVLLRSTTTTTTTTPPPPDTTRRRQHLQATISTIESIAIQAALDQKTAEKNQRLLIQNQEANAAAEAAANPVNALQVLQEKLSMLFSDGFQRKERLRRLQNLIQAAARGDADRVSELLDDETGGKVDLNSCETDAGLCCLVIATINGSLNVVKSCCKRSANLELTDEFGNTALMIAAKQKAITLCRVLLDHGANVNAENKKHDTACTFHFVCCPCLSCFFFVSHANTI